MIIKIMQSSRVTTLFVSSLSVAMLVAACQGDEKGQTAKAARVSFEKQIKPVLEAKCMHCHNKETLPDRVSFENAKLAFAMTKEGKVYIVPGKPEASLLIAAVEAPLFHEKQMPMVGDRLNDEEKAIFRRWVAEGAPWPEGEAGKVKVTFRALE